MPSTDDGEERRWVPWVDTGAGADSTGLTGSTVLPDTNEDEVARLKKRCEKLESSNDHLLCSLEDVELRAQHLEQQLVDMEHQKEYAETRVAQLELKLCRLRFDYEKKLAALEQRLHACEKWW